MYTSSGQLTFCTNIFPGAGWKEHFTQLQQSVPGIKQEVSPDKPFGIGLRLSNTASEELLLGENLSAFTQWMHEHNCYVFTMNGFPYGSFHHTQVKDKVHAPDWTTEERIAYTNRLAMILSHLLPELMEGGISTSPLSYRHWHSQEQLNTVFEQATNNILRVVKQLIEIKEATGKLIHLDIEPEPDGLLESGTEFLQWYQQYLLPKGIDFLQKQFGWDEMKASEALRNHVQLCYDVCHFAVGYEAHEFILQQLNAEGIKVGKIQISAALKAVLPNTEDKRKEVLQAFRQFDEATYLHQVVALQKNGSLVRYPDLPEAINDAGAADAVEWRSHFHVPLFVQDYGLLQSTQQDILQVLALQQLQPFTQHLEVETYTWDVLPAGLKLPLQDSIVRELKWVQELLQRVPSVVALNY
jgi:hypothetical protein